MFKVPWDQGDTSLGVIILISESVSRPSGHDSIGGIAGNANVSRKLGTKGYIPHYNAILGL